MQNSKRGRTSRLRTRPPSVQPRSNPHASTGGTRVGVGLWGCDSVWLTVTLPVRRNLRSLHHVVAGSVGSRLSAWKEVFVEPPLCHNGAS